MRTLALLVSLTLSFAAAAAEKDKVYKWVDKDGVIHYSSQPPTDDAAPAKLPPLQTYKQGTTPNLNKFDKGARGGKAAPGRVQVDLVAPSPDETFRGGERVVPVAVVVTPPLEEGQRLIYMLDGTPDSTPTADTSYVFRNVDRGAHTASVALVDESGQEIGRSGTVTFHMKPPTAKR